MPPVDVGETVCIAVPTVKGLPQPAGGSYATTGAASTTVMSSVTVAVPAGCVAVTTYDVDGTCSVGVPEMTPVVADSAIVIQVLTTGSGISPVVTDNTMLYPALYYGKQHFVRRRRQYDVALKSLLRGATVRPPSPTVRCCTKAFTMGSSFSSAVTDSTMLY